MVSLCYRYYYSLPPFAWHQIRYSGKNINLSHSIWNSVISKPKLTIQAFELVRLDAGAPESDAFPMRI